MSFKLTVDDGAGLRSQKEPSPHLWQYAGGGCYLLL